MSEIDIKEILANLLKEANQQPITYRMICRFLAGKGYPILLIILSIPFCTPITIPGLSTTFGIAIGFIGFRIACGCHLWWPDWLLNQTLSYSTLEKITQTTIKALFRLQKIVHPRLHFLTAHPMFKRMHGLLILFLSFFLALPLPLPFSNMLPALPILTLSLGLLEDDGLFIIIGYILSMICLIAFGLFFWQSAHIFHSLSKK